MSGRSWLALIIAVVGILAIAVGIVYLVEPAHSLPSFFPGHLTHGAGKRSKRGTAALIVGIILVVVGVAIEATRPGSRLNLRRARS